MKNVIKNLAAVIIVAGAIMASRSSFAQSGFVPNDLYLGFENNAGGGSADYIINLGPVSGIIGGSAVVNLSADFTLGNFNSSGLVGTNSATIVGGVVGGSNAGNPSTLYVTLLRSGGAGAPSVPGSTASGSIGRSEINEAYGGISSLDAPSAGTGTLDSSKSWEEHVEPNAAANTFFGVTGINPDSSIATNTVLYEDLWYCTNSALTGTKPFIYAGYFTVTPTAGSFSLTFTPLNAVAALTSPRILSVTKSGTTIQLIWSTVPTHTYTLQATTSLYPTNWANVGSSQLANFNFMTNSDSSATPASKFYRVTGQ